MPQQGALKTLWSFSFSPQSVLALVRPPYLPPSQFRSLLSPPEVVFLASPGLPERAPKAAGAQGCAGGMDPPLSEEQRRGLLHWSIQSAREQAVQAFKAT